MTSTPSLRRSGWRGVSLVAITYVYFLIFAQFAFLRRLADLGVADTHLKVVMAAMAAGGILFSLLASGPLVGVSPRLRLQIAFGICGAASLFSLIHLRVGGSIAVSILIGAGLGLLTVTLVTHLRLWLGERGSILKVGLGTGLGYFVCNLPALFAASPAFQAAASGVLCLAGIVVAGRATDDTVTEAVLPPQDTTSFVRVLLCFTALVWLDSAAFFIIQNTPALKAGTWEGAAHLWINGTLHLAAAIAAAWLLRRRSLPFVLSLSVLFLTSACLLLAHPSRVFLASLFYPIGVSLYSVALVAYPSLLAPASSSMERARRAGLIYAVAGWSGSAMGIGMGQHLGRVPVAFASAACILVIAPQALDLFKHRKREIAAITAVLALALGIHRAILASSPPTTTLSSAERGRQVYISEGCIHCHSQYVRPNTRDVLMWGPTETMDELRAQRPPLIGNRRQGPDLSQVGNRRSKVWLKAHFYDPQELSHASFMPSYAYLFTGPETRGEDLVAYLSSLKSPRTSEHLEAEQAWTPPAADLSSADAAGGAHLFQQYCGTCHNPDGHTRTAWLNGSKRLPPDLAVGPWRHLNPSVPPAARELRLAQIAKFGIPGTDMPGHEYLSNRDICSLALWLSQRIGRPRYSPATQTFSGENQ
jgi:cbb3-type cytochrome oxidase cytochrome c subunit